jgi:hypothetical protein
MRLIKRHLIKRHPRRGAHPRCCARTRSGSRCRRYVAVDPWTKKLRKRCRLHGGLSTGPKFPDAKERALAAANAGLARWRERMRAAKAAGLIAKFPCGRKPGSSRKQRELEAHERDEALARRRVEFMDAHERPRWPARRGGSPLVIDLERLERSLIARLADRDPPQPELIEDVFNRILLFEDVLGRAAGKEERLACLSWAYEAWRTKKAVQKVLAELAQERAAKAAQTSARASDEGEATAPFDQPSATSMARAEASEPPVEDAEAAALARLAAEATGLIAAIKTRCTQNGCHAFDEELARAHDLVRSKAAAEGIEVAERVLRAAEIDLCRRK